mmetsp:Transcript_17105/g.32261  ORF Transcript_17105/g.32261 Transcript_17105/m.32261 type:complete len:188 (+) Transcript_17105:47-610(+)
MDAAATTASTANSKTYGTLFGVRYVRGSGVLRLAYVTLTSLALSVLRVIIDFALGLALVQDSSWLLLVASLVDLALNAQAAAAGRFAVTHPSPGTVAFAAVSFVETALYSTIYLVAIVSEVNRSWRICSPQAPLHVQCSEMDNEVASHGILLIILAVHLSAPCAILQSISAYMASQLPQSPPLETLG